MTSLFEPTAFAALIARVERSSPTSPRQWGTMSPAQMLEHVARAAEMAMGKGPQQQVWLGKLIGWVFRAKFLGPEPFPRNSPTGPDFVITDEPEFTAAKSRLLGVLRDLHAMGEAGCDGHVHGFFGRLSGAEWGVTQYKHVDHHLRQFGI